MSDVHCDYENAAFPAAQFRNDPIYGQIHSVTPLHTIAGDVLDDSPVHIPDTVEFPPGAPVVEIPDLPEPT